LPEAGAREAPRLSIVILPFLNIGGSLEDDPFVDGITEILTTDLSRSSGDFAQHRFRLQGQADRHPPDRP
jgi:TolB-like protein